MTQPAQLGRNVASGWAAQMVRLTARLAAALRLVWPRRGRAAPPPAGRPYPWERAYPEGLSWEVDIEPTSLPALLDQAVAAFADRPCLEFLGKRYTYGQIGELVRRAARGLKDLGMNPGDRVGLFLPNSPYFVICYHAILAAGGIVVNFNPLYAERGIAKQIENSGVRFMVTMNLRALFPKIEGRLDDTCLEKIVVCSMGAALPFPGNALFALFKRSEMASVPSDDRHVRFETLTANDGAIETYAPDPSEVAILQYTGGTTGIPKGAMLTHANLYANTVQTRMWAPGIADGREKMLAVLPLFHVFGMTGVMNVGLYAGAEILLMPRFKVEDALRAIEKERPSVLLGVPTMFSAINGFKEREKYDISSLEICISGGAPLPLEIKSTFEKLTGCVLVEGYGLTEAGPVCTINPIAGLNKAGSAGLPIPGTVVEITALDDPDRVLPVGETGEICITGPQVMRGYWRHDEDTASALRGGRLHTGDVGYLDEDGYVYIIDRIKDLIITGGFNVYPRTVEEAIQLHAAVEDVAVCGIPSPHHGELVKAFVVLRAGEQLSAADLRAFLKDKLAAYEMPRRIEFPDEIPKTMLGKPLRRELVARELKASRRGKAGTKEEQAA